MCGRFTLTAEPEAIQQAFNLSETPSQVQPRYNIAPSQPVAVITNENPQKLDHFKWGLVPFWAKDVKIGYRLINARSETAHEKPSFRAAFKYRRCLIPVDGFYEWVKHEEKHKTPMHIHMKGWKLFAFAGLWERWSSPDGSELYTCTILTTQPNDLMKSIHDRMPVILRPDDYEFWLSDVQNPDALRSLMQPYEDVEAMEAYEVSKLVNKPSNDSPDCVVPIAS